MTASVGISPTSPLFTISESFGSSFNGVQWPVGHPNDVTRIKSPSSFQSSHHCYGFPSSSYLTLSLSICTQVHIKAEHERTTYKFTKCRQSHVAQPCAGHYATRRKGLITSRENVSANAGDNNTSIPPACTAKDATTAAGK